MNELALFTGAGGGLLGTRLLGFRPVCAVELDPYRREILLRRQEEGHLEPFSVWDDIRTFHGSDWRDLVDVVTAGFPCQPFSVAGKQLGEDDPRNLWPDTIRVIREVRPRFCFLENVPGLKAKEYFGTILADLASCGYGVRWDCLRASDCGAPHRRDRLWILAYPSGERLEGIWPRACGASEEEPLSSRCGADEAKTSWWETERGLGRVADGVAHRVDRLGAIGDGQVPGVVVRTWRRLNEHTRVS